MWLELHSMIDSLSQAFQNYPKNDSWTRSLLYYKYPASPVSVSKFQVEDLDNGLGHWERIVKEDLTAESCLLACVERILGSQKSVRLPRCISVSTSIINIKSFLFIILVIQHSPTLSWSLAAISSWESHTLHCSQSKTSLQQLHIQPCTHMTQVYISLAVIFSWV